MVARTALPPCDQPRSAMRAPSTSGRVCKNSSAASTSRRRLSCVIRCVVNLERADFAPSTRIEAIGKKDRVSLGDQQIGHRLMTLCQAIAPRGGYRCTCRRSRAARRPRVSCRSIIRRGGRPEIKRADRDRLSRFRVEVEALEADSLRRRLRRMRDEAGTEERGAKREHPQPSASAAQSSGRLGEPHHGHCCGQSGHRSRRNA